MPYDCEDLLPAASFSTIAAGGRDMPSSISGAAGGGGGEHGDMVRADGSWSGAGVVNVPDFIVQEMGAHYQHQHKQQQPSESNLTRVLSAVSAPTVASLATAAVSTVPTATSSSSFSRLNSWRTSNVGKQPKVPTTPAGLLFSLITRRTEPVLQRWYI